MKAKERQNCGPMAMPNCYGIVPRILRHSIISVVYPRCDSPFDILLGFSGSLAKIETLDGEAHVSPP